MTRPGFGLHAILFAIAALALAVPAWVVTHPPKLPRHPHVVRVQKVVPKTVVPDVEPVAFQDLTPADAREYNAGVPFSTDPNPAARPYRFAGGSEDLSRATDCLAAATYYEAGDDNLGERAVAQVVLNRLRHPAFPKSVCGVVFQGSERSTGCQFTFTCDGAIARYTPSEAAWKRARDVATAALAGSVYKPVGYATHYHTDWVVPYWQSSLDKIVAVHTHLFFRWSGWWGTPPAFNRRWDGSEPAIAALGKLSDAHRTGAALDEAGAAMAEAASVGGVPPPASPSDPDAFLVALPPQQGTRYQAMALQACGERPQCRYMGWTTPGAVPTAQPLTPDQLLAMSFSYIRDRSAGLERALWNCKEFPGAPPGQCMRRIGLRAMAADGPPSGFVVPPTVVPTRGPDDLGGVRRRALSTPAVTPRPSPSPVPTVAVPPAAKPLGTPPAGAP